MIIFAARPRPSRAPAPRVGRTRSPRTGRSTWLALGLALAVLWFVWCLWHGISGEGPLWSVPHAPNSPWGYTTLGGLPLAAAAASQGNPYGGRDPGPEISTDRNPPPPPKDGPGPEYDDQPFWMPKPGEMWTERGLRRTERWTRRGEGESGKLWRTVASVPVVFVLGVGVFLEDGIRNNWGFAVIGRLGQ